MFVFNPGRILRGTLLFLACVFGVGDLAAAQAINTSSIYRNDVIGVRGAFAPEWEIITSREQAPDVLKPNFPENKGPNDSPLFIGVHSSEQLFLRLLTETFFDDLEAYARILSQGITSQGLEIRSIKLADDETALDIEYFHPRLGLHFEERVAILPDSQVIRMAAWTSDASWDSYADVIEEAFSAVELKDAFNTDGGWQPVWSDLPQHLTGDNLAGIPMAARTGGVDNTLECPDPTSSMLWKVEAPALAEQGSELYLFGSIHVGKAEFYPLPDEIETAFRGSDYVVFEVDPRSAADPRIVMNMQTRGMLPRGQTLGDVVSPEVIADFRRLMVNIGIPAETFMGMQPWFVTLMLSALQLNALGYQPEFGLESYFMSQKPAAAEVLELESIQQQIGFLEALNAETYLAYTIKSFDTGSEEIESLIGAWECADKVPLTDMLFADFEDESMNAQEKADMQALMDSLYTQRNIDMAETIEDFIQGEPGRYFVVVGSAHLLGEGSVIELLRGKGFSVNPVSLAP